MQNILTFRKGNRIAPPFSVPTTNLQLWLKSTDIAGVNNDPITAWTDASPAGNNLSTDANSPTLITSAINGYPVCRLTNDRMTTAAAVLSSATQTTTFMVFAPKASTVGFVFIQGTSSFSFENAGGTNGEFYIGNSGGATAGTSVNGTFEVRTLKSDASQMTSYRNGTAGTTVGYSGNTGTSVFKLGHSSNVQADVAELLVYNTLLSDSVIASINSYLGTKYNITIA